ncbi:MAG TPA: redoxin domain-containing protein [Candidatus Angelobacter sp.]|nr:redoxin domain-containing protein [Candidatus Angelobacter sp.]
MKQVIALLALIALTGTAFTEVEVGKPAPDFTATDIYGKTVHLSDYKGKIVVLESYNQDCPFCHNQFKTGAMQELEKEMTGKGVIWLLVNSVNPHNSSHRTPEQARAEWAKYKIGATDWLDDSSGDIGHLYGMKTTPHMFVIDKTGTLVYDGAIDNEPDPEHDPHKADNYVRDALTQVFAGQKVTVSQTKPYGCAVKY